jgi:carboxymethylenebutenolidase
MNASSDPIRETVTLDRGLPLTVVRHGDGRSRASGVLFVPAAFGVAADLEEQMGELAREARVVAAVDPFFRDGRGTIPYGDMPQVMERIRALDMPTVERDVMAAIAWMRTQAVSSLVVVGVCLGAPFALRAAATGAVEAVVTWHGSRLQDHLEGASAIRCPVHFHFGSADPVVPPATVSAVRAAFAGRDDVRVFVHEGATHGFSHRTARAFDAVAEAAAMASVRAFASSTTGHDAKPS